MTDQIGTYWLIQFCPSPGRREAVNLGIVLAVNAGGFLEHRICDKALTRAKTVFAAHKETEVGKMQLSAALANLREIESEVRVSARPVEMVDSLRHRLAGVIRLSKSRSIRVDDPLRVLERLHGRLVVPPQKAATPQRVSVIRQLANLLEQAEIDDYVDRKVPVKLDYGHGLQREHRFPVGYLNGAYNVIQTPHIKSAPGPKDVVHAIAFYKQQSEALQRVRHDDHHVKLVLFAEVENPDDLPKLRSFMGKTIVHTTANPEPLIQEIRSAKLDHAS